jgi:hypothetical protein
MIIAVDFDGTIVENKFPEIGRPIPGAFGALRKLKLMCHKLILWSCRSNNDPSFNHRPLLSEAIDFCLKHGVIFDAVNTNVSEYAGLPSPKIYADLYIDDRAFPLSDAENIWQLIELAINNEKSLLYQKI